MKALMAAAALALLAAGCAGTAGPVSTAGRPAAPASPLPSLTPLRQCVTVVTRLLEQSQAAVREGYPGGISMQSAMEQYGVSSAIWQAFSTLDPQELDYFAENGVASGQDPPQVLQVPRTCEDYLPS